jgi:toxin CcdB
VQTDVLEDLSTRVIVPLVPATDKVSVVRKLNPTFTIDGRRDFMFTHLIATVPAIRLAEPRTNLLHHHDEIVAALDMLFQGF